MRNKKIAGLKGEEIARAYLEGKGYLVVASNFRTREAEIDLVALKKDLLVFIEVKALGSLEDSSLAEEKVNYWKQKKIILASQIFCQRHKNLVDKARQIRYDVIIVDLGKKEVVRHYEAAFYAED